MKLIQITTPEGAVFLLNIAQIKAIIPFGNGSGCNIQMIGDGEDKMYQASIDYEKFMLTLTEAGVSVAYP